MWRGGIRKAKAQLELNLAKVLKNNKKGLCRCVVQKRKMKENAYTTPPINKTGELAANIMQMAEVFGNFFASIFNSNLSSHIFQPHEL